MVSESSKKNWRTGEGLTWKENLTRRVGVPAAALALAAGALTACSNTEAQPQPEPTSTSIETPNPTPTTPDVNPSETPDTDPPSNGEFVGIPSGLVVNYDAFDGWDEIPTPVTAPHAGKWELCYEFFEANGIDIPTNAAGHELDSNGEGLEQNPEELVQSMLARQNMMFALAADDTDPRHPTIAGNLIECLTSGENGPDSPNGSRDYFTDNVAGILNGSVQLGDVTYTLSSFIGGDRPDGDRTVTAYTATNESGEETRFRQVFLGSQVPRSHTIDVIEE